jgi:hypothetical protein
MHVCVRIGLRRAHLVHALAALPSYCTVGVVHWHARLLHRYIVSMHAMIMNGAASYDSSAWTFCEIPIVGWFTPSLVSMVSIDENAKFPLNIRYF